MEYETTNNETEVMNKKLKEKIIKRNQDLRAAFPNLYDQRWVEKAADKGWKQLVKELKETDPRIGELAEKQEGYNVFAVIYYSSFESALNTFFMQCLDDSLTEVQLMLNKLQEVTAEIKAREG